MSRYGLNTITIDFIRERQREIDTDRGEEEQMKRQCEQRSRNWS